MSSQVSGPSAVFTISTKEAIHSLDEYLVALRKTSGDFGSFSASMEQQITQFDKLLRKMGQGYEDGKLSDKMLKDAEKIEAALAKIQKSIETANNAAARQGAGSTGFSGTTDLITQLNRVAERRSLAQGIIGAGEQLKQNTYGPEDNSAARQMAQLRAKEKEDAELLLLLQEEEIENERILLSLRQEQINVKNAQRTASVQETNTPVEQQRRERTRQHYEAQAFAAEQEKRERQEETRNRLLRNMTEQREVFESEKPDPSKEVAYRNKEYFGKLDQEYRASQERAAREWELQKRDAAVARRQEYAEKTLPEMGIRRDIIPGSFNQDISSFYRVQEAQERAAREQRARQLVSRAFSYSDKDELDKQNRINSQTSYSATRGASFEGLVAEKRKIVDTLSRDDTLSTAQIRQYESALRDIESHIRKINQTELNVRVGGSVDDLRRMLDLKERDARGRDERLAIRHERQKLDLGENQQERISSLRAEHSAGRISLADYQRQSDSLTEQFQAENADLSRGQYEDHSAAEQARRARNTRETIRIAREQAAQLRRQAVEEAEAEAEARRASSQRDLTSGIIQTARQQNVVPSFVRNLSNYRSIQNEDFTDLSSRERAVSRQLTAGPAQLARTPEQVTAFQTALRDIQSRLGDINRTELNVRVGGDYNQLRQRLAQDYRFSTDRDSRFEQNQRREQLDLARDQQRDVVDLRTQFRSGAITQEEFDRQSSDLSRMHIRDQRNLKEYQYEESRRNSASNISGIRSEDVVSLSKRRNELQQHTQTPEVLAALREIDTRLTRINATELNIRVGGNTQNELQRIQNDLTHVTDPAARLGLQREQARIQRAQRTQQYIERQQQALLSGSIDEDTFTRRVENRNRRAQETEGRYANLQREEDWAAGRLNPLTGGPGQGPRGVYGQGNNPGDRLRAYNLHQAAFGIDDAIQSYQYGGVKGAIRGASNNLTAILSTAIVNPLTSAMAVVGASIAAIGLPHLLDFGKEAKTTAEAIRELAAELNRLSTLGGIKLGLLDAETSLSPDKIMQERHKREAETEKIRATEIEPAQKVLKELGDIGASGSFEEQQNATPFDDWRRMDVKRVLHNSFSSDSFSREEWAINQAEKFEKLLTEDPENRGFLYEEARAYRRLAEEEKKVNRRAKAEEAETKLSAGQDKVTALDQQSNTRLQDLSFQKELEEHQLNRTGTNARSNIFTRSVTGVRNEAEALWATQKKNYEGMQAYYRDSSISAGGSKPEADRIYEVSMRAFDKEWSNWVESRVQQTRDSLSSLVEDSRISDITTSRLDARAKRTFEHNQSQTEDVAQARADAAALTANKRVSYVAEQDRLAADALAAGNDPAKVANWHKERLKKFDEDWAAWIEQRVEAAEENLLQQNPNISKDLRNWLGKAENAQHLAASQITSLSDPNLRMHEQEQEYWSKVRSDTESAKSIRSSLRSSLSPERAVGEEFKKKSKDIDEMDIDPYEKILLKEASAMQAQNQLREQNTIRQTNTGVEGGSMKSLELQQSLMNAMNPQTTILDRQLQQLQSIRQAMDRAAGRRTVPVFDMI